MITLYGGAISNYYNKIKLALMEKGIAFLEELVLPSQDEAILKLSSLGKIPYIKSDDGYLSESQAILEYLEDAFPPIRSIQRRLSNVPNAGNSFNIWN